MRRWVPMTLAGRLVVTAVVLVAVVSLLIGGAATAAIRSYLSGELDEDLRNTSERAAGALERGLPLPAEPLHGDGMGDRPGGHHEDMPHDEFGFGQRVGTLTAYLSGDGGYGSVIVAGDRTAEWALLSDEVIGQLQELGRDDGARTAELAGLGGYRLRIDEVAGGTLVSGLPTGSVEETVANLVVYELVLGGLGVGVAGVAAWVLVRRQLRPLREIASTAHEVARLPLSEGEVGMTARVPGRLTVQQTEVGQVGSALNTLLGHVERALDRRHQSEQQVRRFVADASHELRTPLAVIMGYAELSGRTGSADPDQLLSSMEKVHVEAARMSGLVDDLLLLARLDAGRPLESGEVDLTRLVLESVADARVVAPGHQWLLDLPDEPVVAVGDPLRMHQVISNLLTNARRHTPTGTRVTARVSYDEPDRSALVVVEDDGPGIAPGLQAKVFERFARGDDARTRSTGGSGLGLALARAIVEAHGGSIGVESRPGLTRFIVRVPTVD